MEAQLDSAPGVAEPEEDVRGTIRLRKGNPFYDGLPWAKLSDEERSMRIREGWLIGQSQSQIARLVKAFQDDGKPSRGMISGHIDRHPELKRESPHRPPGKKKKDAPEAAPAPALTPRQSRSWNVQSFHPNRHKPKEKPKEKEPPAEIVLGDVDEKKAQETPDKGFCAWPVGTPGTKGYRYCWGKIKPDAPRRNNKAPIYCEGHDRLAHLHKK